MSQKPPLTTSDTQVVYKNPWMTVREDTITRNNGQQGIYAYLDVKESVCIIAVNDAGEICLVESYRYPFKQWCWEVPGGGGDGEQIITASKRELEEESGITAKTWEILGRTRVYNGLSNEYQVNVLATDLQYGEFVQSEDETRSRKFVSLAQLNEMIASGEFADNQSIAALYLYKCHLDKVAKKD